ncbi:MAG: DUF4364 family protein [Oscillospiraceae bacterium]|jgi:hypothetical protein|nr:DUF4364 family protein [Oscillospiraceae bacterium]
MERRGFIHDMLDVKVLVLYVMARVLYPVNLQKLYELVYQDDCLSYFDLAEAVPQMVESGHLERIESDRYVITEKGREACMVTEDAVAYPVMQRARDAVENYNRDVRRGSFVKAQVTPRAQGDYAIELSLNDEVSDLLKMELMAPTQKQAYRLSRAFSKNAEAIYHTIMDLLLTDDDESGT